MNGAIDFDLMTPENQHRLTVLDRELAIRSARTHLMDFTKYRMPHYRPAWMHHRIADKLTQVAFKKIRRLIIVMPPQHGKSELASRSFPAFLHGLYPHDRIITGTYNDSYASDFARDVQGIMDTKDYHDIFPRSWITPDGTITRKKRNSEEHELIPVQLPDGTVFTPRGSYMSQGIGGTFTGRKGNWGIIDDPVKNRKDADSPAKRKEVWDWFRSTFRTRMQEDGAIVVIMTRWHEADLAGQLEALMKADPVADQWEILRLPCFRDDLKDPEDPRALDDVLWPEGFSKPYMLQTKATVGSREWSALYQGRPTPPGGLVFKRDWMGQFWRDLPEFEMIIQSWDLSFDEGDNTSFCVGGVWGKAGAHKYLIDMVRERMNFNAQISAIKAMKGKHPRTAKVIVEKKANGAAVITVLNKEISGVVPWSPHTSKVARAEVVAPQFQAGNIWLPHPSIAPWVSDYIEELATFPAGLNDDQVDMTSQALIDLSTVPSYDVAPISLTKTSTFMGRG